jgi:hypothetical protein
MAYSPPLDGAIGYLLVMAAFIYGAIAFSAVTIIEIFVLWRMKWGSLIYSLITSFTMNLVSTFVGILMTYFLMLTPLSYLLIRIDVAPTIGIFLLTFILSVAIEGGIMLVMKRSGHTVKEVWRLAVISNLISYGLLGAGVFIFPEVL